LTAAELVAAVDAAGLDRLGDADQEQREALLAKLGYDRLQYLRALVMVKRTSAVADRYVWDR
jgi:hypothetical protein